MQWRVSAYTWNNATTKREIRAAKSRKLVLRLNAPSTFSCSMAGEHPQAAMITELVTDVTVRGDGVDYFRGRCGNTQDTVADSGHGVSFSFVDYRGVLERRALKVADPLFYSPQEQSDIVWDMIVKVQARTNGNYGITRGVGAVTGVLKQRTIKQGTYVGKEIEAMSNLASGFDWDVSPALVFNLYYPQRGLNNGIGIEYGKTIAGFTRTKTPSSFANDDIVTGGQGTTPVETASATIATDPQGRWDGTYSYPDITDQTTLIARGSWLVARTGLLVPAYSVRLVPGFWRGEAHIGRGDTIRLLARKGRINDNMLVRVSDISIDIGDDGSEDVRLGLVGL